MGVVISALEIIESGIGIVIIPSIAERIERCITIVAGIIADGLRYISPSVICIRYNPGSALVVNRDDVPLQVLLKPEGIEHPFRHTRRAELHANRRTVVIVIEIGQPIRFTVSKPNNLSDNSATVQQIFMGGTVRNLARTDVGIECASVFLCPRPTNESRAGVFFDLRFQQFSQFGIAVFDGVVICGFAVGIS